MLQKYGISVHGCDLLVDLPDERIAGCVASRLQHLPAPVHQPLLLAAELGRGLLVIVLGGLPVPVLVAIKLLLLQVDQLLLQMLDVFLQQRNLVVGGVELVSLLSDDGASFDYLPFHFLVRLLEFLFRLHAVLELFPQGLDLRNFVVELVFEYVNGPFFVLLASLFQFNLELCILCPGFGQLNFNYRFFLDRRRLLIFVLSLEPLYLLVFEEHLTRNLIYFGLQLLLHDYNFLLPFDKLVHFCLQLVFLQQEVSLNFLEVLLLLQVILFLLLMKRGPEISLFLFQDEPRPGLLGFLPRLQLPHYLMLQIIELQSFLLVDCTHAKLLGGERVIQVLVVVGLSVFYLDHVVIDEQVLEIDALLPKQAHGPQILQIGDHANGSNFPEGILRLVHLVHRHPDIIGEDVGGITLEQGLLEYFSEPDLGQTQQLVLFHAIAVVQLYHQISVEMVPELTLARLKQVGLEAVAYLGLDAGVGDSDGGRGPVRLHVEFRDWPHYEVKLGGELVLLEGVDLDVQAQLVILFTHNDLNVIRSILLSAFSQIFQPDLIVLDYQFLYQKQAQKENNIGLFVFQIKLQIGKQRLQLPMAESTELQQVELAFHLHKNKESNKLELRLIFNTLKQFFGNVPEADLAVLYGNYSAILDLEEHQKAVSLEQFKYLYLGVWEQVHRGKSRSPLGVFDFQTHYAITNTKTVSTSLVKLTNEPVFKIFSRQLSEILPYEIIFFDSLYKREERPNMKTPERLIEQTLEAPYFCYGYKIYENLLENYEGPGMNKLVRFLYKVIDFDWIQALKLLKSEIISDSSMSQSQFLVPIFENLSKIQQQIRQEPLDFQILFQKSTTKEPKMGHLEGEKAKKAAELKNILDFASSYSLNIYPHFENPYFRAAAYFIGKRPEQEPKFEELCGDRKLGVMIKFLFARRFLSPVGFSRYYIDLISETKSDPKVEHIMFLKNKSDVVQILSAYYDMHPNELEKVALTCGIVIHKLGKGFNKQYVFLEEMVKTYEYLLRLIMQKQMQKEYMLKMMTIRSSKQPMWEDLIVKPQFRLNCEPRSDDCVFLSMLEKFLYGGDEKWNKLKSKSSVASESMKKHYEIQSKSCPYCNYPNPRCSICLQQIKIFTVKSYLNQEIKKKVQNEPKPYMNLSEPLEQALVWCPSCSHGGHFGHLEAWFRLNKVCSVENCACKCKY